MNEYMYDCIIVGGGPAGLSAGIHLAWHERKVVVMDRRTGPLFFTIEKLQNVPGMPAVRGTDVQRQLKEQALSLGVEVVRGNVTKASGDAGAFLLEDEDGNKWESAALLLATGVARYHPTVDGDFQVCFKYAGKGNLFYCLDCEGPETKDKDTVVIGTGPADWAAGMAVGLSSYTDQMRVVFTGGTDLSSHWAAKLKELGIETAAGKLKELEGPTGNLKALVLEDGTRLEAEAFFVSSKAVGRTDLARQLGVDMAETNNHAQPKSQRGDTNVPGVWIAGDLRPMTQQVSVAMGTGNIAAVMIDQWLRKQDLGKSSS